MSPKRTTHYPADDCLHEDFEPKTPPILYLRGAWRCTGCRLVWSVDSEPVKAWFARIRSAGGTIHEPDEPEPF